MASVNWMKLKGGSMTSAIIAHITRHDWKEGVKYSKGLVTEHTVSLLSDFEKDFKKSKHIDREEPSR